jgi:hypothetical protein
MGLVWSVRVKEGMTRFVLLLPSGWCPIAANLLAQVEDQIAGQSGTQTQLSPAGTSDGQRGALAGRPQPGDSWPLIRQVA